MANETSHGVLSLSALWLALWAGSYGLLGVFFVQRGFIAFVWPVWALMVEVLNVPPDSVAVDVSVATFLGALWTPLPLGIWLRKQGIAVIPFGVLFLNLLSGLLWGHAVISK
jgi:hypothetical protein